MGFVTPRFILLLKSNTLFRLISKRPIGTYMAQYIFIKNRKESNEEVTLNCLRNVCQLLTPDEIKVYSENTIEPWPNSQGSFYAIQNSKYVNNASENNLVIGFIHQINDAKQNISSTSDGSYAVITQSGNDITFFTDQFGSRTLWYYIDSDSIIISTSQRAIIALKQSFHLNQEAIAWFLSSGCQGPFISWDKDIQQVKPNLEYRFDTNLWNLTYEQKPGMDLPKSGSTNWKKYLSVYEQTVKSSINDIVNLENKHEILLPLSGGFDSRLLLGFISNSNLLSRVKLINWGVKQELGLFDDKQAALRIAEYYNKDLLNIYLPKEVDNIDEILNHFIKACEGRIDHFNAFTDNFKVWKEITEAGYPFIIRGDIPYPTGYCINEKQIREKLGLQLFKDYDNQDDFDISNYSNLQYRGFSYPKPSESLIRWRDRTFAEIRVPLILSAFSQQISAYTENRIPMMNWSLYKLYMGLPDSKKGNKAHIVELWKKYDKSGVISNVVPSLKSMISYFEDNKGIAYLIEELKRVETTGLISTQLIQDIIISLLDHDKKPSDSPNYIVLLKSKSKNWVSSKLPLLAKARLKARRPVNISEITLAYRIVMINKTINMFKSDSQCNLDNE